MLLLGSASACRLHATTDHETAGQTELVSNDRDRSTGCQCTVCVVGTWHGHPHASGIMNGPRVSLFSYLAARQHAGFMPQPTMRPPAKPS